MMNPLRVACAALAVMESLRGMGLSPAESIAVLRALAVIEGLRDTGLSPAESIVALRTSARIAEELDRNPHLSNHAARQVALRFLQEEMALQGVIAGKPV